MIVKPVCKEILNGLFALDKSKRKVIVDKTIPEICSTPGVANQREDNLFIGTTPEICSTYHSTVETVENLRSDNMP